MSDIHERNRYKREIDILIQRLEILQEQVKSYVDLTDRINERRKELIQLDEIKQQLGEDIIEKETTIDNLRLKIKEIQAECKYTENQIKYNRELSVKQIEEYNTNKQEYNTKLQTIENEIDKYEIRLDTIEKQTKEEELEFNNFKNRLQNEKQELFNLVDSKEKRLVELGEQEKEVQKNLNNLRDEYNTLDTEYQKILENYILKQ